MVTEVGDMVVLESSERMQSKISNFEKEKTMEYVYCRGKHFKK